MRRLPALLILVALAACQRQSGPPPETRKSIAPTTPAPKTAPAPSPLDTAMSGDAADFLRSYYARIEAGDYKAAWDMRGGANGGIDEARFEANFEPYRTYRATVGTPSLPAEAGGFLYVSIPVMITGRFLTGKSFGTAGRVTLKRPGHGGHWTIVTD